MRWKSIVLVASFLLATLASANTAKWQYREVDINQISTPDPLFVSPDGSFSQQTYTFNVEALNKLGADGWELVSCPGVGYSLRLNVAVSIAHSRATVASCLFKKSF